MNEPKQRGVQPKSNRAPIPTPRPIRFVSNTEDAPSKRRRISAACRTCRRRKTRCSGEKPDCKSCLDAGQPCEGYSAEQGRLGSEAADDVPSRTEHALPAGTAPVSKPNDEKQPSRPGVAREGPRRTQLSDPKNPMSTRISRAEKTTKDDRDRLREHESNDPPSRSSRVPYFRYFGPTAIVPGFKQMVTDVDDAHIRESPESHRDHVTGSDSARRQSYDRRPSTTLETSFYDAGDSKPTSPLIQHLCEVFFSHVGCIYPFLQRESFLKDLREKKVDTILVDAVCAISARFSTHPILTNAGKGTNSPKKGSLHKSKHGRVFAKRAMSRVTESFACPTIAAVQACLLLAYEQFGSDHDSGLWMWLGISIRLAQDLGLQKYDGLSHDVHMGANPNFLTIGPNDHIPVGQHPISKRQSLCARTDSDPMRMRCDREILDKKRNDTFWAVFFLDRAISSGTGRPATLRDTDIEISFPSSDETDPETGWPTPFPFLVRIIHLYGRVTDLLNSIQEIDHVTPDMLQRLAAFESDLTGLYQRLSTKLHFNAGNFQHYAKNSQGANFILLHLWFHTLIVLLHQPTLLHSFQGRIQQLFPNSRELALSSAKTIADIFTFAELIDVKSFVGNPFTSQPVYIAACAFLLESASHSESLSQPHTPEESFIPPTHLESPTSLSADLDGKPTAAVKPDENASSTSEQKEQGSSKHTLLATAANRDYQNCYKSLKLLEKYWAGTRYIVTVLDQKSKGILDPLLYTIEDLQNRLIQQQSTSKSSLDPSGAKSAEDKGASGYLHNLSRLKPPTDPLLPNDNASRLDPSQAFGWSLTGTSNGTPNLSLLYSSSPDGGERIDPSAKPPSMPQMSKRRQSDPWRPIEQQGRQQGRQRQGSAPVASKIPTETLMSRRPSTIPEEIMQYQQLGTQGPTSYPGIPPPDSSYIHDGRPPDMMGYKDRFMAQQQAYDSDASIGSDPAYSEQLGHPNMAGENYDYSQNQGTPGQIDFLNPFTTGYGDASLMSNASGEMMIESQDIDSSALGEDMMLWLDHLPHDAQYSLDPQDPNLADYRDVG